MTMAVLERARAAAGPDAVREPDADRDAVDGVRPSVVVSPASIDQLAATLAWASGDRLRVVVRGSGTKAEWARPVDRIDVVLALDRMTRIVEHAASDLIVTAEAGVPLARLNSVLAEYRQRLAIDPPHADRATIGGLLATNDSGPSRQRYGTPADLVLGATLVTAYGQIARTGGRVVKNVAGYDLARLVAGSHGCLAVIAAATFKLAPLPKATGTAVISGVPADAIGALAQAFTARQLEPTAVDLQADGEPTPRGPVMLVRFSGEPSGVAHAIAEATALARGAGAIVECVDGEAEDGLWKSHGRRPWLSSAVVRLSWLPTDLPRVLAILAESATATRWHAAGRLSVGSGHIGLEADVPALRATIERLRASEVFSHVTVVKAQRDLRLMIDPFAAPSAGISGVWRALKHAWDPADTLGAGRGPC